MLTALRGAGRSQIDNGEDKLEMRVQLQIRLEGSSQFSESYLATIADIPYSEMVALVGADHAEARAAI